VRILRIGTRGSMLAKWQAESVRKKLFAATGMEAEIVIIKTSGDKMQQAPLTQIGGKGIFIKELEEGAAGGNDRSCGAQREGTCRPTFPPGSCFPRCAGAMMCVIAWLAPRSRICGKERAWERAVCGGKRS